MTNLNSYKKSVFSQNGEDGIIEKVMSMLGIQSNGFCVELGAWDGIFNSNTYELIHRRNWSGLLIEANSSKYAMLCKNIPNNNVIKLCEYITLDGLNTLDNILERHCSPKFFDFLSIDIDGCDYYIWKTLDKFRPKLVCIEYNPSIPNEVDFIQECNFTVNHGSSALAIYNLANLKQYTLIASTETNLFFIDKCYADLILGSQRLTIFDLINDTNKKIFIFAGYDGSVLSNVNNFQFPWHFTSIPFIRFQYYPKILRKYPLDYNTLQKIYFLLYTIIKSPESTKQIFKKFGIKRIIKYILRLNK